MERKDHAQEESMGRAKYTALDHGGLEVLPPSEAPEVAHDELWRRQFAKDRKSSLLVPEALHAKPAYGDDGKEMSRDEEGLQHINRQEYEGMQYDGPLDQGYGMQNGKAVGVSEEEVDSGRRRRRYWGMSRRMLIILIAAIVLIVVVGAVLGGVLGTLLNKKKSSSDGASNAPLPTMPNTGLATTISSSDPELLLTYFQDPSGRILENSYKSSTWSLSEHSQINSSVVTTAATPGSPLAAISYDYDNQHYRQIFFVTDTGNIMTTNSTENISDTSTATSWSAAHVIHRDTVAPNSIGLAACASEELMNGIRVFYPSQYGYVQMLRYDFGGNGSWWETDFWNRADTSSGIACAVKDEGSGRKLLNLYTRMKGSGVVKQFWNDFTDGEWGWNENKTPESWANKTIAVGSDIAVASDDSQTEYVYYQLEDGKVTRGILNPNFNHYDTFENFVTAAVGTKLSAAFIDGGSMLLYQNASSDSTIMLENVSRYGAEIAKSPVR
ncbi:uncharacterized protein LTR77_010411 [Saxophila tyrrhenica]|uniref:Fucose-specific lectin n=1 Tax=Saxophila tyrrhenica TaxID=1690608 RepID=A0AAV9NY18_9PEZI|nr:hypothetical protein LTR77_010411 [Saxophila tyrrhenica]